MGTLDNLNVEELLKKQEKCPWLIIITQLMDYDISVDCPYESWARAWVKKQIESELDKNSGLI